MGLYSPSRTTSTIPSLTPAIPTVTTFLSLNKKGSGLLLWGCIAIVICLRHVNNDLSIQ